MTFATDKCCTCKHGAADPDGFYCAHPLAMAESPYGRSPAYMKNKVRFEEPGKPIYVDPLCADDRLYEPCTCTREGCPRHGPDRRMLP